MAHGPLVLFFVSLISLFSCLSDQLSFFFCFRREFDIIAISLAGPKSPNKMKEQIGDV